MFNLNPLTLIVRAIVFITAIPVHEAAHAWAADRMGDPTHPILRTREKHKFRHRIFFKVGNLRFVAHFEPIVSVIRHRRRQIGRAHV